MRGIWNRKTRLWEVRYDRTVQLELQIESKEAYRYYVSGP